MTTRARPFSGSAAATKSRAYAWVENGHLSRGLRKFYTMRAVARAARTFHTANKKPKKSLTKACERGCGCDTKQGEADWPRPSVKQLRHAKLLAVTSPGPDDQPSKNIIFTPQSSGCSQILEERVQLVVWRRHTAPSFVSSLSQPGLEPSALPAFAGVVTQNTAAQRLRDSLAAQKKQVLSKADTDELVRDVEVQVRMFAELTKSKDIHVRLECLDDDGCSFWHQDCVPFRLVTTYRGPCTEWVHPAFSNTTLRRRRFDSEHARSLTHHDVALFKGRGTTLNGSALLRHPGIVHRSPRIDGTGIHRLILVLDIPADFHFQ